MQCNQASPGPVRYVLRGMLPISRRRKTRDYKLPSMTQTQIRPRLAARPRSKTAATWIALLGGGFGLHRFARHGLRDPWGWLHLLGALAGLAGLQRLRAFGIDDASAAWMLPLGGLSFAAAALAAIVTGLTPDERWDAHHNADHPEGTPPSGWAAVLGVIAALLLGATVLMSSIAFGLQRWFEVQAEADRSADQRISVPRK